MVDIAQLVRVSGCGPEGRRFEPGYPPQTAAALRRKTPEAAKRTFAASGVLPVSRRGRLLFRAPRRTARGIFSSLASLGSTSWPPVRPFAGQRRQPCPAGFGEPFRERPNRPDRRGNQANECIKQISGCGAVGSALALGARCRRFESCHSDQSECSYSI